jgi:hypothetical protein
VRVSHPDAQVHTHTHTHTHTEFTAHIYPCRERIQAVMEPASEPLYPDDIALSPFLVMCGCMSPPSPVSSSFFTSTQTKEAGGSDANSADS